MGKDKYKIARYIFIFLILFPGLWLLYFSFFRNWRFPVISGELTLSRWGDLFTLKGDLLSGLVLSLGTSFTVAVISVILGFLTSEKIVRSKYNNTLLLAAYTPYVLSPVVFALTIQVYFAGLGLTGSFIGVCFALLMIVYPYSILFFYNYWNEDLINMKDMVRTLGGTEWESWKRVIFPVSRPVISLCFYQCFIIAWFEYGLTSLLGVGKIQTLPVQIYEYVQEANPFYAAMASCLMIIPPLIMLIINRKKLIDNLKFSPVRNV